MRDYLATPYSASLQIDEHPALSITLTAERNRSQPLVQTRGKYFNSVEHLFGHYNKYNAGSTLNAQLYLKDGCQRLLQYIVFQEGPYSKLSVAQILELSPAEWDEMPALKEIRPVAVVTRTTVAKKQRDVDLSSRCDAIERSLNELSKKNTETSAQVDNIFLVLNDLNKTISTLHNIVKATQSINSTRTRMV